MKFCKNNHAIENIEGKLIILGDCVIHCHGCGYTITLEKVTALYINDMIITSGEVYHRYYFCPNLFCKNCGKKHDTYAVICYSTESALANYKAYRTASNKGVIQC